MATGPEMRKKRDIEDIKRDVQAIHPITNKKTTVSLTCTPRQNWLSVLAYELAPAFKVPKAITDNPPVGIISLQKFKSIVSKYVSNHQSVSVVDNVITIKFRLDPELLFTGPNLSVHVKIVVVDNKIVLSIEGSLIHGVSQILEKFLDMEILGQNAEVGYGFRMSCWPDAEWRQRT